MRCPYCRTALVETSPECPSCRLTLDRAATLLGPIPRLASGVADLTNALRPRTRKRLQKAIRRLEWRFPQVQFHLVCHFFPTDQPFELQVFWLFNCGGLSGEHLKTGENRAILLALDPAQTRAALMVGYGLEPFISSDALDHLLDLASPAWAKRDWERGLLGLVAGLDHLLETTAIEVAEGFGLPVTTELPADY